MESAKRYLLQNYKQQPVVIDRGQGCRVWDADGRGYLDFIAGIATCALGHCHPAVVAALKAQADKLWHVSNAFYSAPQIELAERLVKLSGMDRAFFCNSGAEANEAMIKLARKVQKDRGQPDRYELISFDNSFHGRTLATLTATGQPKYQKGFEPLPTGFVQCAYGDLEAVRRLVSPRTSGILVECIQGEGGVRAAPAGFLRSLRKLCDEQGLLLLVDEIQTGMGRTGKMFAYQHEDVRPDACTLAKALGNGIPIGAMLCREEHAKSLSSGTHGSTFGGNPLAATAANVTVALVSDPAMLQGVGELGTHFRALLEGVKTRHPGKVVEVRGQGLLVGVEVTDDAAAVAARCRENGMLVNLAGEKTVRFAPPLNVTREELSEATSIFENALAV